MAVRKGDFIWCHHVKGARMKGLVLEIIDKNNFMVRTYLPISKDEKKKKYIEETILTASEIKEVI